MTPKKTPEPAKKKSDSTKESQGFGGQFLSSLQQYFSKKKEKPSANTGKNKKTKKEKTVRVSKEKGLSLLMNKYIKLARSGMVRGNSKPTIKTQAVASPVLEKKTDEAEALLDLVSEDNTKNEQEFLATQSIEDSKDINEKDALDLGLIGSAENETENKNDQPLLESDLAIPEFDADAIKDGELQDFIEIPEALLKEAKDLEIMTKDLSKEELEDAANFLGVFKSGGVNMTKFKDYAGPEPEESASSAGLGASLGQLSKFLSQQKELLSSLGTLSIFNRQNAKKLQKLMESVPEDGEIEIRKKKKGASEEVSSVDKAASAPAKAEAGDPTLLDSDTLLQTGATSADEKEQSSENSLGMEELSKEDQIKKRMELAEDSKNVEKKGLLRRKKKETVDDIKKEGLGIDIESTVKKPEYKKVNKGELLEEIGDEDFLESTTAARDQEVAAPKEMTAAEKKAFAKEQAKKQKEEEKRQQDLGKKQQQEEKRWAEEAKRREVLLKKKEEERKKRDKKMRKGGKVKIIIPKKVNKQSKLKSFLNSLNYMGMGKERVGFIANLGTMMDAGLPLLDALHSLELEAKNKQMKKVLNRIITAIELGSPLWRAMDAQYFFLPQQVSMVRVGEEAGNLVENLKYLQIQSEKDESLKSKVKTAMIYPIIIFTMLTCIIMGLGIFVLPNLIQVIYSLGVPLPFITRMIIAFTNIFQNHGTVVIPGFFGGAIFLMLLTKYTSFKIVVQWMMYKVPGIGPLLINATLSRFGVVMNGLLQAGLPVTEALESLASVTPLVRYKKFYYQLLEQIKLGDSFRTSFKKLKLTDKCFPTSVQQLVVTGEQSGSLTKIMGKIADIHDKRAGDIAEKLPVILEPMLLLFIGSLVGGIALGILAPIYSIVGNVG